MILPPPPLPALSLHRVFFYLGCVCTKLSLYFTHIFCAGIMGEFTRKLSVFAKCSLCQNKIINFMMRFIFIMSKYFGSIRVPT
jgi:hypothetical protein